MLHEIMGKYSGIQHLRLLSASSIQPVLESSSQSVVAMKEPDQESVRPSKFQQIGLITQSQAELEYMRPLWAKHCHDSKKTVKATAAKDVSRPLGPPAPARSGLTL